MLSQATTIMGSSKKLEQFLLPRIERKIAEIITANTLARISDHSAIHYRTARSDLFTAGLEAYTAAKNAKRAAGIV